MNNFVPSEVFIGGKDPFIFDGSQDDRDIIQEFALVGEDKVPSVVTPANRPKKVRGGTMKYSSKCHSMITQDSKIGVGNSVQELVVGEEGDIIRTWNLAEEMNKVIEKCVALGVISNSNKEEETEIEGNSELWNLKEEVAKIIETRKALGFDFDGREEEMSIVVTR